MDNKDTKGITAAAGIEGLTRFNFEKDYLGDGEYSYYMDESTDGEYVRFADVERLLGARAQVAANLTDKRIEKLWHEAGCKVSVDTKAMKFEFARAIEREVLGAHAGVVAAEPVDAAYVRRLEGHALCLLDAATVYAFAYMQDEAEDPEDCVCGEEQHERAKAVFAAIKSLSKVLDAAPAAQAPVQNDEEVRSIVREAVEAAFEERDGWRVKIAAAVRALASKEVAAAAAPSETALLDSMDAWVEQNKRAGHNYFVFAFDTISSAREQIAADDTLRDALKAQQSAQREKGGE